MPHPFPADFLWGAATSAFQIEGAHDADGRGESIWDRFCRTPGAVLDGANGDVACDHYHRWREDIALMKSLGLQAYRFSIAWPRILPTGRGTVNQAGLDFYRQLVEELLRNDIRPYATLYHWDLPQALEDAGGWPVRATAEAFVEYADAVTRALGDVVKDWITHNEPWCASFLDYQIGKHAPGRQEWPAAIAASHHLLLSHGWAVPVIRRNSADAQVGITLNFTHADAASPSVADAAAALWFDGYFNRWFLDPVHHGRYPADMVQAYTEAGYIPNGMTMVQPGDMAAITARTDFLGVNYYTREVSRADVADNLPRTIFTAPESERTAMGWENYPDGLYYVLRRLAEEYNSAPLYITENGVSYLDEPGPDGQIDDTRRIDYLRTHFAAAQRAIDHGVPLLGYFVWSLMDNFEWDQGYKQRFGIVHVDYATQQRTPKRSAHWYRDVIARNGLE